MQVILMKEVLGLGDPGEVVKVKNGYGRNYLIPQGMALEATKRNVARIETEQSRIQATLAREAEKVRADAEKMEGVSVTVKAKAGESGKLYGSVTNMDLAGKLAEQGFDIDRRRIVMDEGPLKSVGEYDIKVKLHPHVSVMIKAIVEADIDEAELAAKAAAKAAEEAAAEAEQAAEQAPVDEAAEESAEAEEAEQTDEAEETKEAKEE
jgi:large subunit ribosomal protein L9